jgi:hypothetical protein
MDSVDFNNLSILTIQMYRSTNGYAADLLQIIKYVYIFIHIIHIVHTVMIRL